MTVDELTRQTIYRREDWQRVYDHAAALELLHVWPELARTCAEGGITPRMAHAMIDLVAPRLTSIELDRALAEFESPFRRERIWPWVLLAFVLLFAGMVFFWLAVR